MNEASVVTDRQTHTHTSGVMYGACPFYIIPPECTGVIGLWVVEVSRASIF